MAFDSASFDPILRAQGDMRPLLQLLEARLEEAAPALYRAFYPRVYENVHKWPSPKLPGMFLGSMLYAMMQIVDWKTAPTAGKLLYPGLRALVATEVPLMFLAPDFLEAVLRTDFDDDINWTTLQLPYEAGIIIPPTNTLRHPVDGDVAFIVWIRSHAGTYKPPIAGLGLPEVELEGAGFSIVAMCPFNDNPVWYDSHLTASHRPTLKLRNLFYAAEEQPFPELPVSTMDAPLEAGDAAFLEQLGVAVFGTFLALNARPALLSHGQRQGKAVTKTGRTFWSPNVIGANYQLKRQPQGGTHASPRMHWRRGHFTNQAYGPKRELRKQLWLDPMLVGSKE